MIQTAQSIKMKEIRETTISLIKNIEDNWYEVSKYLLSIYQEKLYEYWDYENFKEYIDYELHIEYRTAMYRIAVIKSMLKYNINKEVISDIGWTKYKTIMPYLSTNQDTNNELINTAKSLSVRELESKLKKINNKSESFKLVLNLNMEQKQLIEDAIEKAKEIMGIQDNNRAFEAIITDWLSNYA